MTNPETGVSVLPSSLKGGKLTSLLPDGNHNPAALNIEIDVAQAPLHIPTGQSLLRIYGLSLKDLNNAYNLGQFGRPPTSPDDPTNGARISLFAGMSRGLPLANPAQQGLLVKGSVLQAYGNWQSTDMYVDLIFGPTIGSVDAPYNFVLQWSAGTTLSNALRNTLTTVYQTEKIDIQISDRLTLNHDETGYWQTFEQLGGWLVRRSKAIITDNGYPGVAMLWDGTTLRVRDFTGPPSPAKQILFRDLIGQPVYIRPNVIQVKVVMRGDLVPFDLVSLPRGGPVTTTAAAFQRFQDQSLFSGNYQIQTIHHWGNFRQPDAASWNTTLEMIPEIKGV
jgi:hypothetical protein